MYVSSDDDCMIVNVLWYMQW